MKAGFIGLGGMGAPMARNLAKAGYLTVIWNRSPEKAAGLAGELGITTATSPSNLALQVDVIFLCVSADQDVLAMVEGILPALNSDKIVVDHSTVSKNTALRAAALIRTTGADFLDIPVSGGVEGARNGTLSMMAGGSADSLEKITPLLKAMAGRILHMGEVGNGQATKAVNQIMCAGINQAVTEALGFAAAQGLELPKVIEAVAGGAAGNWFLDKRGLTMTADCFTPGFKLALHQKDLKICLAMAEALDYPLPLSALTVRDYAQLIQDGYGDDDISGLYRLKRPHS